MTNNDLQSTPQKTKHQVTRTSLTIEGELKCLHTCHKQVTTMLCIYHTGSRKDIYILYTFSAKYKDKESEIRKWLTGFWSHSPNDVEVCSKELNASSST
jgi:hypothetical protein